MSEPTDGTTVDVAALGEHAEKLRASAERLLRIQHDLRALDEAIRPNPVDSGFGSFPAAIGAYVRYAAVVGSLSDVLQDAIADVKTVVDANKQIADNYNAAEQANDGLMRPDRHGA